MNSGKQELRDKNGNLTHYGFACGYIEEFFAKSEDRNIRIQMYLEHNCFHVQAYDSIRQEKLLWVCPEYLSEGQRIISRIKKIIKKEGEFIEKVVAHLIYLQRKYNRLNTQSS